MTDITARAVLHHGFEQCVSTHSHTGASHGVLILRLEMMLGSLKVVLLVTGIRGTLHVFVIVAVAIQAEDSGSRSSATSYQY